jgi:hypothetical protein
MAGLSGRVDDQRRPEVLESSKDGFPVADVQFIVAEAWMSCCQSALVPARVALRTEEVGPHVVINAVDLPPEPAEIIHDLRTN